MLFALGSYTRMGGPGVALMEETENGLRMLCATNAALDPTWVMQSPHHPHILYSGASLNGKGAVASFQWSRDEIRLLSLQPTGGGSCCHVTVDADETHLYAASYRDGTVSVLPLENGMIGPCLQALPYTAPTGPNEERQECSHAHQCVFRPGTEELFVCNLGTDQVVVYERQENGLLVWKQSIPAKAGTGPRHLLFDGSDRFYLAGELDGWLSCYECKEGTWQMQSIQPTLDMPFEGENTAAAIYRDETHIYVSNRGHDSIACFLLQEGKAPVLEACIKIPGSFPRDFRLWKNGFLLAQQERGGVALMDRAGTAICSLPCPGVVRICPLNEK